MSAPAPSLLPALNRRLPLTVSSSDSNTGNDTAAGVAFEGDASRVHH